MDLQEKYEDLLKENDLLLDYIHSYQEELEKYSGHLDKLDKCTEKDPYYESLDLKRRQERQEAVVQALWESINWIGESRDWSARKILRKMLCSVSPKYLYFLLLLLANNYEPLKRYNDKFGSDKTVIMLENLPLLPSTRAKVSTELARYCRTRDNRSSLKYSILAWKADPKAYRLKFLAFSMHRIGESKKALAILESLPEEQILSDSEMRLFAKIKALYGNE